MKPLKAGVVALRMDRRQLLARFGAVLGTASLGGCLSQYREIEGEAGDGTETTEEATTDAEATTTGETTDEGTVTGEGRGVTQTFTVTDHGCGQPTNEASVAFDAADASVAVTGTIGGPDACHTARLANVSYDPETGTLDVTVVSTREEGAGACAQCLVAIDYEATFAFAEELPQTVTVTHEAMGESEVVVTAESDQ